MIMFKFFPKEITWEIVGGWTAKDCDYKYVGVWKQWAWEYMDGIPISRKTKPCFIFRGYIVKGFELLIYSKEVDSSVLNFHEVIDLSKVSEASELWLSKKTPWFGGLDRVLILGEFFFYDFSWKPAFALRVPEKNYLYDWEEFRSFGNALKHRIMAANE